MTPQAVARGARTIAAAVQLDRQKTGRRPTDVNHRRVTGGQLRTLNRKSFGVPGNRHGNNRPVVSERSDRTKRIARVKTVERLDEYLSLRFVRAAMMIYVLALSAAGVWVVMV